MLRDCIHLVDGARRQGKTLGQMKLDVLSKYEKRGGGVVTAPAFAELGEIPVVLLVLELDRARAAAPGDELLF